jgi:protein-S-isoprenylcysteine O-methyltransferase Ste14
LKGVRELRAEAPEFKTKAGAARTIGIGVAVFLLTSAFFVAVDRLYPEWMPDGEILLAALGFLVLSRFFSRRQIFERRYGDRAYGRALQAYVMPGLGIIAASIGHLAYIPGPAIPELWWKPVVLGIGWLALAIGISLWLRAVQALGVDALFMLYVYHPNAGVHAQSGIYGLMRHPVYGAALRVAAGLALIHANWYALLVLPVLWLFFVGWITFVEERELVNRSPEYAAYRRRVPAFGPLPRHIAQFWCLLLMGS